LEYEEHIKELGGKIIGLNETNKTLTADKKAAEASALSSATAAKTAGEELLKEKGKVTELTKKVGEITKEKGKAEEDKIAALDQKDEYLRVLKQIEKNRFDFFPDREGELRYSSVDKNKMFNLTSIRDAAIGLKIVNGKGMFDLNKKNQIDEKLRFLEEVNAAGYTIFDENGDFDNDKKAGFIDHLRTIDGTKKR
jgi:hypothetical protein